MNRETTLCNVSATCQIRTKILTYGVSRDNSHCGSYLIYSIPALWTLHVLALVNSDHLKCPMSCMVYSLCRQKMHPRIYNDYKAPLPLRRGAVRLPVLILWASPTNSPINLLYVSESCCKASRVCRRYVNSDEVLTVCVFRSDKIDSSLSMGRSVSESMISS